MNLFTKIITILVMAVIFFIPLSVFVLIMGWVVLGIQSVWGIILN